MQTLLNQECTSSYGARRKRVKEIKKNGYAKSAGPLRWTRRCYHAHPTAEHKHLNFYKREKCGTAFAIQWTGAACKTPLRCCGGQTADLHCFMKLLWPYPLYFIHAGRYSAWIGTNGGFWRWKVDFLRNYRFGCCRIGPTRCWRKYCAFMQSSKINKYSFLVSFENQSFFKSYSNWFIIHF